MNKKQMLDGVTHINVYSKGQTPLGRFLSNFALYPIETEDGVFNTIEGYWYWISSRDDKLRIMSGADAKKYGRYIGSKDWIDDLEFKRKIKSAIKIKVLNSKLILKKFAESTLPFEHYYCYGEKVMRVPKSKWIIEFLESLRMENK